MNKLVAQLQGVVGVDAVLSDTNSIAFYTNDIYSKGSDCIAVIRPDNIADLQAIVSLCYQQGVAIFTRGGGVSYTSGYLPNCERSIVIDTVGLNRIVMINETDMYVTVETGVTWKQLHEALAEKGLRTPFWGPFSGVAASVGGTISQHAISHGSAMYGGSADSVISIDVINGVGEILSTGAAAHINGVPFSRTSGPDLTGLFCGDCGTLGVKASISLRLIKLPKQQHGLSFKFRDFDSMNAAMAEIARAELADESVGLDPQFQQNLASQQSIGLQVEIAKAIFRASKNIFSALYKLTKMALNGKAFLEQPGFGANFVLSGMNKVVIDAKIQATREIAYQFGDEIPNSMPTVMITMPFAPLNNILGVQGERWVPINGCMPFSECKGFHRDWMAVLHRYQSEMDTQNMFIAGMYSAISTNIFLYEIAFYWQDTRSSFHNTVLDDDYLAGLQTFSPSPDGRALVETLRKEAITLWHERGATHLQLGKAYPFLSSRVPAASKALSDIKHNMDPQNLFNPGALGFSSNTE
jgi:FAD/FMN-containing dehydrogenase